MEPNPNRPLRVRVLGRDSRSIATIRDLVANLAATDPLMAPISLEATRAGTESPDATSEAVDVVLLDVDPLTEDLLRQLTSIRQEAPDVPVIGILRGTDPDVQGALARAGVTECFAKTWIERGALPRTLAQARRVQRLRDEVAARERALERSERRFRDLIDASTDGLIVIDQAGKIAFANPAAAAMFSQPCAALEGSEFGHPVGGAVTTEIEILRGDRSVGVAEMRVVAMLWNDSPAWLALLRDVTPFKQAEAKLRASAEEIAARNEELEDLAVILSHDLQAPLRRIRMFGQHLADRAGDRLDQDDKVALGHLLHATERMRGLLRDLLDLTRVSARTPGFEQVDLGQLAAEVANDLATLPLDGEGRIEIGGLPVVQGDPAQLRLVLQNLIANALKYRRPDVPPQVRIEGVPAEPGTQAFCVTDNGIGFEPSQAERIFTPFQRLHTADAYPGSGIGLAICRKIVERHRGRIEAHGEPGRGARFVVALPGAAPTSLWLPAGFTNRQR